MLILIDLWKTYVLFTRKERRAGYCSSINGRSSLTCRPRKKKPTRRERHRQRQTDQRRSKLKIEIVPKPVFVEYLFPSWAGTPPPPSAGRWTFPWARGGRGWPTVLSALSMLLSVFCGLGRPLCAQIAINWKWRARTEQK